MSATRKYTTAEVIAKLNARYAQREGRWANVVEFQAIDFLAVACWQSLGFAVHGHEIKVSRSDWLRELKKPHKARFSMARCDYWWLAAPPGVAKPEEIPLGWGFIELGPNGFRVIMKAPRLRTKLERNRLLLDGSPNLDFFNREAFAMMARRYAYADADREALLSGFTEDPQPWLDEAATRTGRFTAATRMAQRNYRIADAKRRKEWTARMVEGRLSTIDD